MKITPLNNKHLDLGAKMVEFAGFSMPILYSNLKEEHHCVRKGVGMFDVSHMGEFFIEGPQAFELLQWITSNNVADLSDGRVQYTCFPNKEGGIVDDALLYRIRRDKYMLVVNASNLEKDLKWINEHNTFEAKVTNLSEDYALLAVQGPKATQILQTLCDTSLSDIPYYHFEIGTFAGFDNVIISNTGYTGSGGFELYIKSHDASALWDQVMEAGKTEKIQACGLGARDTLRLEKGFCLYGNDINDTTSPIEAGLGWITKFEHPFIHSQYHAQLKTNKPSKKLVGFELIDRGIPRQDYPILDENGAEIGVVTSGTMSPTLNKAIGMGYVQSTHSKFDSELFIGIRGKSIKAKVCKLPFLK
ncbi:MAG: glycine cleavage system aminomethyltransferase GcvT [Bacteroidia bacterium]|nr:glycine cleavage system aminomethyltransferase GcvT [Bacteroidia bacterium]